MTLEAGQVVDRYRLTELLHHDVHRDVYGAVDLAHGRPVTLTVIRPANDPAVLHELDERARQAAQLPDHAHLASVYDWGHLPDAWYVVSQPVDGVGLADIVGHEPMPVRDTIGLLGQLADALDVAHRHHVVHGAVAPPNIVVHRYAGTTTAHLINLATPPTATPRATGATPGRGTTKQSAPSDDLRDVAAIAFELLTGRPRPAGSSAPGHGKGSMPSAAALNPELPPAVDTVLAAGLATDPNQQPRSCTDFVEQLAAVLRPELADSPGTHTRRAPDAPPRSGRRRWVLGVSAVAIVAAATTVVFAATAGQRSDHRSAASNRTSTTVTPSPPTTTIAATTTTTTTTTSTTTTSTTTTPTTTVPVGAFGFPVGSPISEPNGPEAAYAVALQQRANPLAVAPAGSPAMLYAQWIRVAGAPADQPVTATANGFAVTADQPVTLQDFRTDGGLVTSFSECVGDVCTPIDAMTEVPPQDCVPAPGCPHLRSQNGDISAMLRATLFPRWPARMLLFELLPDDATPAVVTVQNPNQVVHYDPDTHYLVILFDDQPPSGTRHQLTINLDDGTTDQLSIFYG